LDQQSLNDEQYTEAQIDTTEEVRTESRMPFWDWCPDSDDEQTKEIFLEDTQVTKDAQRNYNLCNKGPTPIISLSKEDNIPLKTTTPPPSTSKSNVPTQRENQRQIR
jgi:hypothetical protein